MLPDKLIDHFVVDGSEGGYTAVPGQFPAGAIAYLLTPSEQSSNPRPGPSIAVRLAPLSRWSGLSFAVTIPPAA